MDENRGTWLSTAMALMLAWSLMIFSVRVWAKMQTKNWGLDDYTLSTALILVIVHSALFWRAIQQGYGQPEDAIAAPDLRDIQGLLYAANILYVIVMGICRSSAALFIGHIAHKGPQSGPARLLAWVSVAWTIACIMVVAIRGDTARPWASLDGSQDVFVRWIAIDCSGLALDLILWALSIRLVWSLQMRLRKRLFVLVIFGVRLLLIPIVILRLYYLAPARNDDLTLTSIIPNIFTIIAAYSSVTACCATSLKPFLHAFNQPSYSYNTSDTVQSGRSGRSTYHKLETWRRVQRSNDDSGSHPGSWRPAGESTTGHAMPAKVYARGGAVSGLAPTPPLSSKKWAPRKESDDAASAESDASDRLIIQRTMEVSVKYEN